MLTRRSLAASLATAVCAALLSPSPASALTCTVVFNTGFHGAIDCVEDDPTVGEGVHGACKYAAQPMPGNQFLITVSGVAQTLPASAPAWTTQLGCQVVDAAGVAVAQVNSFVFGDTAFGQTSVLVSAPATFTLCLYAQGTYTNWNTYTIGWLCT